MTMDDGLSGLDDRFFLGGRIIIMVGLKGGLIASFLGGGGYMVSGVEGREKQSVREGEREEEGERREWKEGGRVWGEGREVGYGVKEGR